MEYKQFAKYYDLFYQSKDYEYEVAYLKNFIKENDTILDVGCGTGMHGSILEKQGYLVDGVDLSQEMLDFAKNRMHGILYQQNILNLNINKKYDVIICMFAVLNHLKNKKELIKTLKQFKKLLNPKGRIIIDLHNPQCSGERFDEFNDMIRIMKWKYDKRRKIETSKIVLHIDNIEYKDFHKFKIFTIKNMHNCCKAAELKIVRIFENYDVKKNGTTTSKNLQFLIQLNEKI